MGCANIAKKNVKAIEAAAGNSLVVRSGCWFNVARGWPLSVLASSRI